MASVRLVRFEGMAVRLRSRPLEILDFKRAACPMSEAGNKAICRSRRPSRRSQCVVAPTAGLNIVAPVAGCGLVVEARAGDTSDDPDLVATMDFFVFEDFGASSEASFGFLFFEDFGAFFEDFGVSIFEAIDPDMVLNGTWCQ